MTLFEPTPSMPRLRPVGRRQMRKCLNRQRASTAPDGGAVYQPPARDNWGPTVAPGSYRAEAETDIVQPCFIQQHGGGVVVTSGLLDPDTEQGINPLGAPTPVS